VEEVSRLEWQGCNKPVAVNDHVEPVLLRNCSTRRFVGESMKKQGGFIERRVPFELLENEETGKVTLVSSVGRHESFYNIAGDRRKRKSVTIGGEAFEVIPVSRMRSRFSRVLGNWLQQHYKLGPLEQKTYMGVGIGELLDFLWDEAALSCIPESLNDFIILTPIAIRILMTVNGIELNLKRQSHRDAILDEVKRLIHKKHETRSKAEEEEEEEEDEDNDGQVLRMITRKRTFSNAVSTDTVMYTTTAEEIMSFVALLRRLDTKSMHGFLTVCLDVIANEEDLAETVQTPVEVVVRLDDDLDDSNSDSARNLA